MADISNVNVNEIKDISDALEGLTCMCIYAKQKCQDR